MRSLTNYATGVEYVIVNGRVVLDRGQHTGARPGTILYGRESCKVAPQRVVCTVASLA